MYANYAFDAEVVVVEEECGKIDVFHVGKLMFSSIIPELRFCRLTSNVSASSKIILFGVWCFFAVGILLPD